jgi:hypothetical protein
MKGTSFLLVLAGFLAPAAAMAQVPDADRATARALARQGNDAQKRGDYAIAAEDFERADALVHAPTLLLGLARAQTGLGKLVEAQETCERIIREGVDAHAPAAFARAVDDAKREVTALAPRLAWVTIDIRGPSTPTVDMDSAAISPAALGIRRACNPGRHTVKAFADGFAPGEKIFVVAEGGNQTVTLSLNALPAPPATVAVAPRPQQEDLPQSAESSRSTPLGTKAGMAALGVGAAGLVLGGITGVLALAKHASLSRACPDGHCSPSESSDLGTYHTLATVSTVSTLVGACVAVTGVALLIATPRPTRAAVYAGFLRVEIAGTF